MTVTQQSKALGVMLGLACGDALGAQIEFSRRDSHPIQRDFTGGGPHGLKPGQWTDDTAMALLLADHILDNNDPTVSYRNRLADRWIGWMTEGQGSCTGTCFDIGTQTRSALAHWAAHGFAPPEKADQRGNGALMRVAPVAIANLYNPLSLRGAAMRQATVTHPSECGEVCQTFAMVLREMMRRLTPQRAHNFLRQNYPIIRRRTRQQVKSTGYDVDTFEAAVWAVCGADNAEDAIIRAVNLGDDADTVGAVAGALAGAVWGMNSLPARWLDALAWRGVIAAKAQRLYDLGCRDTD
jgi:ADP-ribosyl-[dinitrogen reductase] hydrolase